MFAPAQVRAGRGMLLLLVAGCCAWTGTNLAAAEASSSAPPPPPLEILGRLPAAQLATMSPNGKLVAIDEEKQGGVRQVTIFDVDAAKVLRAVAVEAENKIRDLVWADDETLLINVSYAHSYYCKPNVLCEAEWRRTLAIRMDGSPARTLLNDGNEKRYVTGATLLAARTAQPGVVTMATLDHSFARQRVDSGTNIDQKEQDKSGWSWAAYSVDTRSGKEKLLATGTPYTDAWVVDHAGQPVARSEWQPDQSLFTVYAKQGLGWKEIYKRNDGSRLKLAGLDLVGTAIVALGANGQPRTQAWSMPLDGSPIASLHADPQGDIDVAIHDANRNAIVGVTGSSGRDIKWFDPKFAAQEKSLRNAFKGLDVRVLERSVVGRRVLVYVDGPSYPPVYQLVDFDQGKADIVAEQYPGLDPKALGSLGEITYLARDGTSIPAYLTLPAGMAGRNLPTVILPHGGPESRDYPDFDYLVQFLATRGYAVLQPQFRGSTGYGEAFRRAGYRQWGGLMQDDVSDGVRHLVATGIADPDRVCIVGLSYGGYAALAGATFTPDLYACAASVAGISDLPMLLGSELKSADNSYGGSVEYWFDHIGPANDPHTIAKSPARWAAKVRAPVLLIHGAEDTVVPIQQSKTMERALKEAGKEVTMVTLPGEDHWLSRSATRVRVLQELESFLAKYLH